MEYTLNLHGRLMDLSQPQVMGILNVTPDSFYAGSRVQTERDIAARANQIVAEGGSMIDVGGYSNAWSLSTYKQGAKNKTEAWDELEKSIIANMADDVIVGIIGGKVEITIKKSFE